MLTVVGNGPSRLDYNLDEIGQWWGCNKVYQDYTPELLFCGDIEMQNLVIHRDQYYKKNKLFWMGAEVLDISVLDMIQMAMRESHQNIREFVHPEDTHFVVQGNMTYCDFLGFNGSHSGNIIMYNNQLLKNIFTGQIALGYALESGHQEVELLGFDILDPDINSVDNVYQGTGNSYEQVYTYEDRVNMAQKSQFIALLQHYSDRKVYFKKSLDERVLIDYTKLPYYINNREWLLGIGFRDDHEAYGELTEMEFNL